MNRPLCSGERPLTPATDRHWQQQRRSYILLGKRAADRGCLVASPGSSAAVPLSCAAPAAEPRQTVRAGEWLRTLWGGTQTCRALEGTHNNHMLPAAIMHNISYDGLKLPVTNYQQLAHGPCSSSHALTAHGLVEVSPPHRHNNAIRQQFSCSHCTWEYAADTSAQVAKLCHPIASTTVAWHKYNSCTHTP
jgi:hypothetical protein